MHPWSCSVRICVIRVSPANPGVMSATIQLNFIVQSIAGLVTAGISDHIGRRPVTLICLSLLLAGGFKDLFWLVAWNHGIL